MTKPTLAGYDSSRRVTAEAHCPVIVLARGTEARLEALIA